MKKSIFTSTILLSICITSCSGDLSKNTETNELEQILAEPENEASNVHKGPIVIGNLEIAAEDFPNQMKWFHAAQECAKLGDGWRLPTIEEMHILYENREKIGGFEKYGSYWSSNSDSDFPTKAWILQFSDGLQYSKVKSDFEYRFRPVRNKLQ